MFPLATRRCLAARSMPVRRHLPAVRYVQDGVKSKPEGSDDAFNPQKTSPESQQEGGAKEAAQANLPATPGDSPANPQASQQRDPQEGGSQGSKPEEGGGGSDRSGPSGGGSAPKAGGGKSGGGGAH